MFERAIKYFQDMSREMIFLHACSKLCLEAQIALSSRDTEHSNDRVQVIVSLSQYINVLGGEGRPKCNNLVIFLFARGLSR